MITKVEIDLTPEISYDMLDEYLEENYPLKFLAEEDGPMMRVYTDEVGVPRLQLLVDFFWKVQGPKRLVTQPDPEEPVAV